MSNEIEATTTGTVDRGLHQAGAVSMYTDHERDMLRALGGLDEASDGDLDMLKTVADRTGLDPFIKQIYLIGRKTKTGGYRGEPERWETKWTVQAGIDGFRDVTRRYGRSMGERVEIGAPRYYNRDGAECPFWLKEWGYPAAAIVEVRVGDTVGVGIATWDEFVQTKKDGKPNSMWEKMGPTMLAKCAEAQGHRKVCSLNSGMYVDEEMLQANQPVQMVAKRTNSRGLAGVQAALAKAPATVEHEPAAIEQATTEVDPIVAEFTQKFMNAMTLDELEAVAPAKGELVKDSPQHVAVVDAYMERRASLETELFESMEGQ